MPLSMDDGDRKPIVETVRNKAEHGRGDDRPGQIEAPRQFLKVIDQKLLMIAVSADYAAVDLTRGRAALRRRSHLPPVSRIQSLD